jgi:hypothetical protein
MSRLGQAGWAVCRSWAMCWVVVERAGGVEQAGIWSGPRVGKERERKRKMESGPTKLRVGISSQEKGRGNRKSFYFQNLF